MSRQITKVPGFQFSGLACGIKPGRVKDLALIYSETPALALGTFTQHPAAAAPVLLSKKHIRSGQAQAIVINSGNANACTGKRGERDAQAMVRQTAQSLGIAQQKVLVCSTGVIGVPLPIQKVTKGIEKGAVSLRGDRLKSAAQAILTTDQGIKTAGTRGRVGRSAYHLVSFAKGAGMIEPNMATMLAFVMTDLALDKRWASALFKEAVKASFNAVSVDGDTSTNDTALLLANGHAGNAPLKAGRPGAKRFAQELYEQLLSLALAMVADGEGATKVVTLNVKGARNKRQAERIAYGIANSQLVRTSFYGADPNWGRILAAVGNTDATCRPSKVDISYGAVKVCRNGMDTGPAQERKARQVLKKAQFSVTIDLKSGQSAHTIHSSDLSIDYVKLNSNYRT